MYPDANIYYQEGFNVWFKFNYLSQGASLSEILFSYVFEKYIVCDVCGLRSCSFESSLVLIITYTYTSSMQDLILQGMK